MRGRSYLGPAPNSPAVRDSSVAPPVCEGGGACAVPPPCRLVSPGPSLRALCPPSEGRAHQCAPSPRQALFRPTRVRRETRWHRLTADKSRDLRRHTAEVERLTTQVHTPRDGSSDTLASPSVLCPRITGSGFGDLAETGHTLSYSVSDLRLNLTCVSFGPQHDAMVLSRLQGGDGESYLPINFKDYHVYIISSEHYAVFCRLLIMKICVVWIKLCGEVV